MRLGCADRMAFGITRPAHEPLMIELHLGETNSIIDVQGGLRPRLVECPSLKRSFSSLAFIVSQPTRRTILMGLHWRSPSCSLQVAQSRSSSSASTVPAYIDLIFQTLLSKRLSRPWEELSNQDRMSESASSQKYKFFSDKG